MACLWAGEYDVYAHHGIANLSCKSWGKDSSTAAWRSEAAGWREVQGTAGGSVWRMLIEHWTLPVHEISINFIFNRKPSAQRRHSLDTTWTELDYTLDASVNVAASHLLSKRRISSKVSQSFSKRKKCSRSKFERYITSQTLQVCLTFWFGHHALKTMSRQVNC